MNGTVSSSDQAFQGADSPAAVAASHRRGACFEALIPIRWGDLDARQHLNNTLYFRLMEEARIQAFHRIGGERQGAEGIILASIGCDFLRPVTYPATVRLMHQVVRIGRSSLEMEVLIERSDEPEVPVAKGREVLVWVDYDSGKSRPWPERVLAHLRPD